MADSDNRNSLFSYIVNEFTDQTELVATKALAYILGRSPAASDALRELLRTGGADVGSIASVEAESTGDDTGRVDLALRNDADEERVLIEAKFWAGLTGNQPAAYLERLPNDGKPSVLLFVAPEMRLGTLWPLIRSEAGKGGFTLGADARTGEPGALRTAAVRGSKRQASKRRLMLTSWRALLDAMASRANIAHDAAAEEDIRQLNALCERQDTEEFLPLQEGEFGPNFPRRLRDMRRLVDDATDLARKDGIVSTARLKITPRQVGYGRYLRLGSKAKNVWAEAWLGVDYEEWLEQEGCPLWLKFHHSKDMAIKDVRRKIGFERLPIFLPVKAEYDAVRDELIEDLRWYARRLSGEVDDDEWRSEWPGNSPPRR